MLHYDQALNDVLLKTAGSVLHERLGEDSLPGVVSTVQTDLTAAAIRAFPV